jgi:recombination protein RecA
VARIASPPHDAARAARRRREALELAVYQIRRRHGAGAIYRMGERPRAAVEGWSTGALSLDLALGGPGLPRGRVVELFGAEASGKTTLALHAVAACQRAGGTVAYVDVEHALDLGYAQRLGVELDALLLAQPGSGDEALGIVDLMARGGGVDLVVVDSVAALQPREDLELGFEAATPGSLARLVSQALRRLVPGANRGRTTLVFVNQLRHELRGGGLPAREVTPGGWALRFFSAARIEVRRLRDLTADGAPVGARTRARVVKNKLAPPFASCEFDLRFGEGIDRAADLVACGRRAGVLADPGLRFGDRELGAPGAAAAAVAGDASLAGALEHAVRERWAAYRP